MFDVPFSFKCSKCGREPQTDWNVCALCGEVFCSDHLIVRKRVATCESCAVERERLEAESGVTDEDVDHVVALIRADVESTIGPGHEQTIADAAASRRLYARDRVSYMDTVVEEVQQFLHDTFVDTSWPACPQHRNHPLWIFDGQWCCQRAKEPIARLGTLADVRPTLRS